MMGIRNKAKVPKEFEGIELVVCYESFTTDDEQGRPVSVAEGDLLSTDAELVQRFGSHFFCDAGLPTWDRHQLKMKHYK